MFSAMILKNNKPNTFKKSESNIYFRNAINKYGNIKGSIIYSFTYQLQIMIMTFIAFLIAGNWILSIEISIIITFFFFYYTILHTLGFLTNTYSLIFKKEDIL
jgi:hypothetical protein